MAPITVRHRKNCRICGSTELVRWVHLPRMPLTDDMRPSESSGDEFLHDIDVYRCSSCSVSQILHDIDYQDYYRDYNFSLAGSPFAERFMSRLAHAVFERYHLAAGSTVIEVGSGDGTQLSFFKEVGARVFGFEPSGALCRASESRGVSVYEGLFTEDSLSRIPQEYRHADVLLLTYTFDHIPEPLKFLEAARAMINPQTGLLVIEVHDLRKIMGRREYCLFEHEHSVYLSAGTLQSVLARAGFDLLSTDLLPEAERRGNSLLAVAAIKGSVHSRQALPPIDDRYVREWSSYSSFNDRMTESIRKLDEFVNAHVAAGRRVAGYGAGGRGVMTLATMESAGKVNYLCDRNEHFHGKVTPKSHVPVVSPEMLSKEPVDVLLVFSFGYIDEIREHLSALPNAPDQIVSLLEVL